jgi:hypothetical protein
MITVSCILAGSSRERLRITVAMFKRLASFHQVMPEFVEFISVFGQQNATGGRFCDFKSRYQLDNPPLTALVCNQLGRSGRHYQMCYNLRATGQRTNEIWSIRQAVFHHQFDVDEGSGLWISAKGDRDIKSIIDDLTKSLDHKQFQGLNERFALTLKVHTALCNWSRKNWLRYIESLENSQEVSLSDNLCGQLIILKRIGHAT